MKKIILSFLLFFFLPNIYGQNYLINFKGSGASVTVDSVRIENLNQCKCKTIVGNDTLHLLGSIGIREKNSCVENSIRVFPSPMADYCSLEFETINSVKAIIELFDITGKRIKKEVASLTEGLHKFSINGLSSGVYFLRVITGKTQYSTKILSLNIHRSNFRIDYKGTLSFDGQRNELSKTGNTNEPIYKKVISDMQYTSGDKLKVTGYSGNTYRTIFVFTPVNSQTVTFNFTDCTDADGNHYPIVQIGNQVWMAENLRTTKYQNIENIPNIVSNSVWGNLLTGAYCNYNNTQSSDTIKLYGRLYNWYALNDSRNVAPSGWHVPSDAEWTILSDYLGGMNNAGGKLKDKCSNFWHFPNTGATNETGFSSLPSGYRFLDGTFDEFGNWCVWWTSTSSTSNTAPTRALFFDDSGLGRDISDKKDGFAIRCIKN